MGPNLVVLAPEVFDNHLGIDSVLKPLHRKALIPKLSIEALVRSVLPGFAGIDGHRFNVRGVEPAQNSTRDEFRAVVGTQVTRSAVDSHQPRQHLDHPVRADAARYIDREALARVFIDHREAL